MKHPVKTLSICLAATVLCQSAGTAVEEAKWFPLPEPSNSFDASPLERVKIDALTSDIARTNVDSDKTVQALIAMAKDRTLSPPARREVIFAIGKIPTKASFDFLIANISIEVGGLLMGGSDDGRLQATPYLYSLLRGTGGWNTVKAVLDSLDAPKPKNDLINFAILLRGYWPDWAKVVVDHELAKLQNVKNERKKNLMVIQKHLQG